MKFSVSVGWAVHRQNHEPVGNSQRHLLYVGKPAQRSGSPTYISKIKYESYIQGRKLDLI
ncbi:hypothetical protein [Nostoc sp. MS1]|uniref:hypothetical protein n=1 Tax=Nostoc sp. MS1 TaxID=2764711 RepID=UPI001CC6B3F6|nr:hypothetical protein [Nostoc sp. MS1]BCL39564.1 hypothetical protein NSMS1_60110 [Nostoc sp. MS1]